MFAGSNFCAFAFFFVFTILKAKTFSQKTLKFLKSKIRPF